MYSRSLTIFGVVLDFLKGLSPGFIRQGGEFISGKGLIQNATGKGNRYYFFDQNLSFYKRSLITLSLSIFWNLFSLPAFCQDEALKKLTELQSAIDTASSQIQRLEDSILVNQKNVDRSREEMKKYLIKVHEKSSDIMELINYLYRMKPFSPLLTAFTLKKVEDIVHLNIALKAVSPHTSDRFKADLELLQNLAKVRTQLKEERLELETLEKDKKKTVILLKRQFNDLKDLLYATDQILPLRHFDSENQVQELVDRLTIHAMNCEKITKLPAGEENEIVLTPPTILENVLYYHNLKDRIVRAPLEGEVLLAGNHVEMGGIILIQKNDYIILMKGIDKIIRYPGTTVKQQQSLGMIFGSIEKPKDLTVSMWQCKIRSSGSQE